MALAAGNTIIPGKGTVFFGPPNTPMPNKALIDPTDPTTFPGLECIGHTSRTNAVSLAKEGGAATTKGSWWDASLAESREPVTWRWTVNALQLDYATLIRAFPAGRVTSDGKFITPSDYGTAEHTIYVLCIDGPKRAGIWNPRSSVALGDAPSISIDDFFEVQLAGSMLSATEANGDVKVGDLIGWDMPSPITVPAPALYSASPTAAKTGQRVTIVGQAVAGATAVTMGGTAMTGVLPVGQYSISAVIPTGSAGSAPIVVTTPAGTSAQLAYTRGGAA